MTDVEAIEDNLYAFPLFRPWPRAETYDGPDLLWALTDIPHPLFNSIGRANLSEVEADAAIDAAIARCKGRNVSMLWWTGPSTRPTDLGARLIEHGFEHADDAVGMIARLDACNTDVPEVPGLTIELVRDRDALRTWSAVVITSQSYIDARYELYAAQPERSFRHYLGLLNGRPVATASLFLAQGGAGIYNVYTIDAERRRGIGAVLTKVAIDDARSLGYASATLQASAMSVELYRRFGFEERCTIGRYTWTAG